MPVKSRLTVLIACIAVLVGFLTILPYVTHVFTPGYAGLTVLRDKDYGNYYSRMQRALDGHPEESANAITAVGSGIQGMQTAGVEKFAGTFFAWTSLPAPPLAVILTALLTPALFVLFYVLFKEIGFDEQWALGLDITLFIAMFGPLSRMPHPGWSFIPAIGALIVFLRFAKAPSFNTALGAALLLGSLPFLYFWHWTFVWAACGSIALLTPSLLRRSWLCVVLGVLTLLIASPFLLHTAALMANPLYPEVAIRASFLYQRTPESWPRTILLLVQLGVFASLWRVFRHDRSYLLSLGILAGLILAMHQNVFHNKVLMLASHFEPQMILASCIAGVWVLSRKVDLVRRGIVAGIAALLLAGGAYDYAFMNEFFIPTEKDFREQHLLQPIALLREQPAGTVLTDATTGRTVTAWTHHGIVYTTHSRFLFISDEAMAESFCMSEVFAEEIRPLRALYIEYNRVLDSLAMRQREESLVTELCQQVRAEPMKYMRAYGVRYILENSKERPDWHVDRSIAALAVIGSGSGWTLWELAR